MAKVKPTTKRDEVQKTEKNPKGFYCLLERTYGTHRTNGYSTFAKALYEVRRYWSIQPFTKTASILINGKLLYQMDVATRKETFFMSVFDTYRKNYVKQNGHDMDSLPSLKAEDRKIFMRGGIPFRLGKETAIVEGGVGGTSIVYRVKVDTSSPEYKEIGSKLNILSEYNFWVKANEARQGQYNQILMGLIDNEPNKLYILVKPEDTKDPWDFDVYVAGKTVNNIGSERVEFDPFLDSDDLP